jgi:hypothetical protein
MACHAAVFLRDPSSSVHLYLTSRLSQLYDFGADIVNQRIEYVEKETGDSGSGIVWQEMIFKRELYDSVYTLWE